MPEKIKRSMWNNPRSEWEILNIKIDDTTSQVHFVEDEEQKKQLKAFTTPIDPDFWWQIYD
jgi:hypothetical protein